MENKEKLVDRIRKLLALSKSSNVHEAELAMSKVNELLTTHQIAMSEVLMEDVKTNGVNFGSSRKVSETYRSFVKQMAQAAGHIFDCGVVGTGVQGGYAFVGTKEDILASEILFDYLFASWKSIVSFDTKQWKERMYETRQYEVKQYKIGHGQGFSIAVHRRAHELVKQRKSQVAASGTSLIVLKDQLVKDFIKDNTVNARGSYKFQHTGFHEGKARGEAIPLSGALTKDKQGQLT